MNVETYEIEDSLTEASQMAHDSEALELIEKLGLEGQKKRSNGETVTRNPYQAMSEEERIVFKALFPQVAHLEAYSADVIPLRVLQVAAHAKGGGLFTRVEVWYPKEARYDDPVLVGVIKEGYSELFFKLARWGRALLPFEKLRSEAFTKMKARRIDALNKIKAEVDREVMLAPSIESLEVISKAPYFSNDWGNWS